MVMGLFSALASCGPKPSARAALSSSTLRTIARASRCEGFCDRTAFARAYAASVSPFFRSSAASATSARVAPFLRDGREPGLGARIFRVPAQRALVRGFGALERSHGARILRDRQIALHGHRAVAQEVAAHLAIVRIAAQRLLDALEPFIHVPGLDELLAVAESFATRTTGQRQRR